MRPLYLLLIVYIGLFLSACSTVNHPDTVLKKQKIQHLAKQPIPIEKNPLAVAVYNNTQIPAAHYTVLGKAIISEYNPVGIKRQEACIRDALRNLAATMGGDAVIELDKNNKTVTGTVIAFDNEKKRNDSSG